MHKPTAAECLVYKHRTNPPQHYYIVRSIIALTISLELFFNALQAFDLETLAWAITNTISFSSRPDSSTSPSDSSSASGMAAAGPVRPVLAEWSAAPAEVTSLLSFSAAAIWACWLMSSILASPNTMYVSDAGFLYTSGLFMTNPLVELLRSCHLGLLAHVLNLGLSKHNVCVRCRVLVHIRFVDDKKDVLALANSDACDVRDVFEAELAHHLTSLLLCAALLTSLAFQDCRSIITIGLGILGFQLRHAVRVVRAILDDRLASGGGFVDLGELRHCDVVVFLSNKSEVTYDQFVQH